MKKLIKILIVIIIIILTIEGFFITKKIFSKYPNPRLCSIATTCERYCLNIGTPTCIVPAASNDKATFTKIVKGNFTIWNILMPQQKYCSCPATGNLTEPKVMDQLNDFYSNNKK